MYEEQLFAGYEYAIDSIETLEIYIPTIDVWGLMRQGLVDMMVKMYELTLQMIMDMFPVIVAILGAIIGLQVASHLVHVGLDMPRMQNFFMTTDTDQMAESGDKGSGFWADDLDGGRTWCPYEDRQMTIDDD